MSDYKKIDWADVREGDVLLHENGDRLTVRAVEYVMGLPPVVAALNVRLHPDSWASAGFTLYRKAEPVPTVPGAYSDRDGNPWMYDEAGDWNDRAGGFYPRAAPRVQAAAPFTRLVPMPSSDAVMEVVQRAEPMCMRERITDAVMALLRGGDDE